MSELVVRRLLVDMDRAIARDWCDGDAFKSAFFNALSMSFPEGEQFFIDSVRAGLADLPQEGQRQHAQAVKGFIGQEATHRRLHGQYNQHLTALGYANDWQRRIVKRRQRLEGKDARHWVAVTAGYEHFTAILARWLVARPDVLGQDDARLATLWLWHSAEESEHRSVAFDLYRALGGSEVWRKRWFWLVTAFFVSDVARQTWSILRRDAKQWRASTWRSAWVFLWGRGGMVRAIWSDWRAYWSSDFHPLHQDDAAARDWLAAHAQDYRVVGDAAVPAAV